MTELANAERAAKARPVLAMFVAPIGVTPWAYFTARTDTMAPPGSFSTMFPMHLGRQWLLGFAMCVIATAVLMLVARLARRPREAWLTVTVYVVACGVMAAASQADAVGMILLGTIYGLPMGLAYWFVDRRMCWIRGAGSGFAPITPSGR